MMMMTMMMQMQMQMKMMKVDLMKTIAFFCVYYHHPWTW
jgi:hypothetical protein